MDNLGSLLTETRKAFADAPALDDTDRTLTYRQLSEAASAIKRALLSVVARNCNTGFKYFAIDHRILDNGQGPILLEPVRGTITMGARPVAAVHILNHAGQRSGKTLEVRSGRFTVDGTRDRALYYEVEYR